MPYPFAHPAAVLPLARPLGRLAVPSALAIGSMSPDLWYFVPLLSRSDSHSLAGLAWFCVPAGLIAYALFHLLLKQPLIALISPRLGAFTPAGLPPVPWHAVIVSLLVGGLTHLGWDELTHSYDHGSQHNWLQHASTAFGSAVLAWWSAQKLRRVPPVPGPLSRLARICIACALAAAALVAALHAADLPSSDDLRALRRFLRTGGIAALQALGAALFIYCLVFQRKMIRRAA